MAYYLQATTTTTSFICMTVSTYSNVAPCICTFPQEGRGTGLSSCTNRFRRKIVHWKKFVNDHIEPRISDQQPRSLDWRPNFMWSPTNRNCLFVIVADKRDTPLSSLVAGHKNIFRRYDLSRVRLSHATFEARTARVVEKKSDVAALTRSSLICWENNASHNKTMDPSPENNRAAWYQGPMKLEVVKSYGATRKKSYQHAYHLSLPLATTVGRY